mmetsp:Transcript_30600/g.29222  ORF Transcript_30600/g.29222 Transcript_30600/m.29222 type:complete len:223 (+) Transcript_30600:162-830(+)
MSNDAICLGSYVKSLTHLFTKIRDKDTKHCEFVKYANRLMSIICEEGFTYSHAFSAGTTVITPTNTPFEGIVPDLSSIIAISIIRAGDSLLQSFLNIIPEAKSGKILIQRNEETSMPVLHYTKLPVITSSSTVVLLDPMLATAGSATCAIQQILLLTKASEVNITFICVVAAPEGIKALHNVYPLVTIVVGEIDQRLNEKNYVIPGLGDYGDRYYGTEPETV